MRSKYRSQDEIPDEVIKEQFAGCTGVEFSARSFNFIEFRSIRFGDLGVGLPLKRVLPLIGITPQMLRPVFNPQRKVVKRHFPFNLRWFGLNKNRYTTVTVELPLIIETYDQLGSFPLSEGPFQALARVLGKSVTVLREEGGTGDLYPLFTTHPSGEIVQNH
ncbi:MAG TPA: hypothetical protein VFT87_01680 [Candidatus Saccharimonadales bacterium]|nr:hypothetical protein [Candidatus Saccharimonadales bacterium]